MYYNHRGEKIFYQNTLLNPFLDVSLAGITYPDSNYRIVHNISHDFLYDYYVFEYIVSGKGYIETKHNKFTVQAGDFYFLNKLKQHTYYSDSTDPYKKIFVVFKGRFVDSLVQAYQIKDSVLLRHCDVYDMMMELLRVLDTDNPLSYELLSTKILQLFQVLCEITTTSQSISVNYAEVVKKYIDSNLMNALTLDTICRDCHISSSHLERIFTATYHISPLRYVAQAKVLQVASMLVNTNYSLSEIADSLSYSDVKYMSRCFKKYIGESPRSYRKKALSNIIRNKEEE